VAAGGLEELVLDVERVRAEEVDHARDPALLLREVLALEVEARADAAAVLERDGPAGRGRARVALVLDEDVAEVEDAVDVRRALDHRLVLEHGADDRVRDRAPRREELAREQRHVPREREQRQHGLVRVDRRRQQRAEVRDRLRRVQLGAAKAGSAVWAASVTSSNHLWANSCVLSYAKPRTWSTYSKRSG
jgi:hypothetical protein